MDSPKKLKLRYGQRVVEVEYKDGEGLKKEVFNMDELKDSDLFFHIIKNMELVTIHSGETTLEDIFIKVTGVKLR
jgi:fluoroquinolone transport system ATP-binding protein